MPRALYLLAALAALLLAGCSTVESRIQEKSSTFAGLPPEQQQALREGRIEVGYTEDMAYIALGKPDEIKERTTGAGVIKVWTYLAYSEEYAGQRTVGFSRRVYVDPRTGRAHVIFIPVEASLYRERTEEVLRVEFSDGRIRAIEQPKQT